MFTVNDTVVVFPLLFILVVLIYCFEWLLSFISIERLHKKLKIPHVKLFQGEHLFPGWSTYLLVNKYWGSSYFPVNDTLQ